MFWEQIVETKPEGSFAGVNISELTRPFWEIIGDALDTS